MITKAEAGIEQWKSGLCQSDNAVGMVFVLHMIKWGSIPSSYMVHRAGQKWFLRAKPSISPEHWQVWPLNQITNRGQIRCVFSMLLTMKIGTLNILVFKKNWQI